MKKTFPIVLLCGAVVGGGALLTMWHYNHQETQGIETVMEKEKVVTLKTGDYIPDKEKGKNLPYTFAGYSKEDSIVITWGTLSDTGQVVEEERYISVREGIFFELPDDRLSPGMNVKATVLKTNPEKEKLTLKLAYTRKKLTE